MSLLFFFNQASVAAPFSNTGPGRSGVTVEQAGWVGMSSRVAAVLLAALTAVPLIVPAKQARAAEDPCWVKGAGSIAQVQLQLPAQVPFTVKGTRQFNVVPDPCWVGESTYSTVLFQLPAQPPFTVKPTRQANHVPEPGWLGEPTIVPLALALPPATALPFANPRRFDVATDIPAFRQFPFETPLAPQDVLPFKNPRRFDHVPEPTWFAAGTSPVSIIYTLPTAAVQPFANRPWLGPIASPDWVEGGGAVPQVLLQFPAQPPFTARQARRFDYVAEPGWLGEPSAVPASVALPPSAALPFSNPRRFDVATEIPGFISIPFETPLMPQAVLPFFNARRTSEHVPDPVWQGTPKPVPSFFLPVPIVLPFANEGWKGPIPDPNWVDGGGAVPQVLLQFPATPPFTVRGTQKFDHFVDAFWPGRAGNAPLSLVLPPFALPSVTTLGTRQFSRDDDALWAARNLRSGAIFLSTHFAVRTGIRANEPVYLLEVQAYNPNTTLLEIKRFSTVTLSTRPDDDPANTVYDGRMVNAGELKRAMFENGATIGKPTTNVGYFEFNNADRALDYLLDYGIGGWAFTLKILADRDDYVSTATTVFVGTMRGFASSDLRKTIQIRIRDKMESLSRPLLSTRYAGTTNSSSATAEGDSNMAGKLKPYSIGVTFQCPVEPANSFDLIYQGSITAQSTMLVYDGGTLLTQGSDYASITALRSATIAAGTYGTALSLGLFRLGAAPAKAVFALQGSSASEANLSAGAVAKQILLDGGVLLADIDTASFDALTSNSGNWEVGIFINDEKTVLDAACQVLNNVAATLISTAAGKYKAVSIGTFPDSFSFNPIFQDETPVDTYTNDDLSDNSQFVLQASPQAEGDGVPAYAVNIKYHRKWQTYSRGDLVDGVSPAVIADAAKEYRELAQGNLAIRTAQPLAQFLNVETLHSGGNGAIILGFRLFDFYSKRRDYLTFDLPATRAGTVDLGDIVIVKPTDGSGNPRYGYGTDGKKMCVIGRHDKFGEGKVTLTVWG